MDEHSGLERGPWTHQILAVQQVRQGYSVLAR